MTDRTETARRASLRPLALAAFLALVLLLPRGDAAAFGPPQMVHNQDQALSEAYSFLVDLDAGRFDIAADRLGLRVRNSPAFASFYNQASYLMNSLGGPSYERTLVNMQPTPYLPGLPQSNYLQLRYRSVHPTGAVFQDVNLELEGDGIWRVVGFFFSPTY